MRDAIFIAEYSRQLKIVLICSICNGGWLESHHLVNLILWLADCRKSTPLTSCSPQIYEISTNLFLPCSSNSILHPIDLQGPLWKLKCGNNSYAEKLLLSSHLFRQEHCTNPCHPSHVIREIHKKKYAPQHFSIIFEFVFARPHCNKQIKILLMNSIYW